MAGRPAIPTQVKKLRGTAQPCRVNPKEVEHDALENFPAAPELLSPPAKKRWFEILAAADKMGYLSAIALPQLERYIMLQETFTDAWAQCHGKGGKLQTVIKNGNVLRRNPYYDIMMSTSVEMRQIEVQWGWTPSSQSRVSSQAEAEEEHDEYGLY